MRSVDQFDALVIDAHVAGAAALWSSRFAPVQASDARLGVANAAPFAHVGDELRQAARDGLAALLRSRLAAPAAVFLRRSVSKAR